MNTYLKQLHTPCLSTHETEIEKQIMLTQNDDKPMIAGILTFTTKEYVPIAHMLVESVLQFTTYPITIVSFDCVFSHSSKRVNNIVVHLKKDTGNWTNNCVLKMHACSLSPYRNTMYLDTDIIVSPLFEQWFNDNIMYLEISNTLLSTNHPHLPSGKCLSYNEYIKPFYTKLGINELKHYIFAAAFGFNSNFLQNFEKIYEVGEKMIHDNTFLPTGDECLLNLFLHEKDLAYDCGYDFIPNYGMFESWILGKLEDDPKYIEDYRDWGKNHEYAEWSRRIEPVLFHGNKDITQADDMIKQMIAKYDIIN
jgi:hypothetical protein